jgi:hypothetical protein
LVTHVRVRIRQRLDYWLDRAPVAQRAERPHSVAPRFDAPAFERADEWLERRAAGGDERARRFMPDRQIHLRLPRLHLAVHDRVDEGRVRQQFDEDAQHGARFGRFF